MVMVCVELGRDTAELIVSVRSDPAIVEAMDMVRDCMLPWLATLVLLPGPTFTGGGEPAGLIWSVGEASLPPDSLLRFGITLPLIVCVYSLSRE